MCWLSTTNEHHGVFPPANKEDDDDDQADHSGRGDSGKRQNQYCNIHVKKFLFTRGEGEPDVLEQHLDGVPTLQ